MTTEELIAKHGTWLRRLARDLLRDGASAEDMQQEVWLTTLAHPAQSDRPVRAWLGRILVNRIRNERRAESRRSVREELVAAEVADKPPPSPEDMARLAELQRLLVEAIEGLDGPFRQAIHLRYFEGLEPSEISRRLGVPGGTVRWRLATAVGRIRQRLDGAYERDTRRWAVLLVPFAGPIGGRSATRGLQRLFFPLVLASATGAVLLALLSQSGARVATSEPARGPAVGVESTPSRPVLSTAGAIVSECAVARDLGEQLASRRRELGAHDHWWRIYARTALNPEAQRRAVPVYERAMKAHGRCEHSMECRGWLCQAKLLVPLQSGVSDCFPPHDTDWPFTSRFQSRDAGPTFDVVSGRPFRIHELYYALADAPEVTHPPSIAPGLLAERPLPPRLTADCRADAERLRNDLFLTEQILVEALPPQDAFRWSAPNEQVEAEVAAELGRLLEMRHPERSFNVHCRGSLCAIEARPELEPALVNQWICPHARASRPPICNLARDRRGWYLRLSQASYRSPILIQAHRPEYDGTRESPAYVRVHTAAERNRADSIAFVEDVIRRVDATRLFEVCERRWPEQNGALDIRIRYGTPAVPEEGTGAVAISQGGSLAAAPLGRCVMDAITAFHQGLEVPPLRNGFVLDSTLDFPGARSLWGRRRR
jgi:RNA polymerase sigma factor (sigma-70 family)